MSDKVYDEVEHSKNDVIDIIKTTQDIVILDRKYGKTDYRSLGLTWIEAISFIRDLNASQFVKTEFDDDLQRSGRVYIFKKHLFRHGPNGINALIYIKFKIRIVLKDDKRIIEVWSFHKDE